MNNFPDNPNSKPNTAFAKRNKYGDIIDDSDSWTSNNNGSNWEMDGMGKTPENDSIDGMKESRIEGLAEKSVEQPPDLKDGVSELINSSLSSKMFICTNMGLIGIIIGGGFGGIVGGVQGAFLGYQYQLHQQLPAYRQFVFQSSFASATNFGVWLGCYSSARCTAVAIRNKDDSLNALFSGGVAGMVSSLRTRNPRAILISGLVSGISVFALELISGK